MTTGVFSALVPVTTVRATLKGVLTLGRQLSKELQRLVLVAKTPFNILAMSMLHPGKHIEIDKEAAQVVVIRTTR